MLSNAFSTYYFLIAYSSFLLLLVVTQGNLIATSRSDECNDKISCHFGSIPAVWSNESPPGNKLHPTNVKCKPRNYLNTFSQLRSETFDGQNSDPSNPNSIRLNSSSSSTPPHPTKTPSWARNGGGGAAQASERVTPVRLLFISDSIDRFIVQDVCQKMGGKTRWAGGQELLHLHPQINGGNTRTGHGTPAASATETAEAIGQHPGAMVTVTVTAAKHEMGKRITLRRLGASGPTAANDARAATVTQGSYQDLATESKALGHFVVQCVGAGGVEMMIVYLPGVHGSGPYHRNETGNFRQRIGIAVDLWRRYAEGHPPHLVVTSSLLWDLSRMAEFDLPAVYGTAVYGGGASPTPPKEITARGTATAGADEEGGDRGGASLSSPLTFSDHVGAPKRGRQTGTEPPENGKAGKSDSAGEQGRGSRRHVQAVRATPRGGAGASGGAAAFAGRGNALEPGGRAFDTEGSPSQQIQDNGGRRRSTDTNDHNNNDFKGRNAHGYNNSVSRRKEIGTEDEKDKGNSSASGSRFNGYSTVNGSYFVIRRIRARASQGRALAAEGGSSQPPKTTLPLLLGRPLLESWRANFTQVLKASRNAFPQARLYLTHTYPMPLQNLSTGVFKSPDKSFMRESYVDQLNEEIKKAALEECLELVDYRRISDQVDPELAHRDNIHLSRMLNIEIFNVYVNYVCDVTLAAWRRHHHGRSGRGGGGDGNVTDPAALRVALGGGPAHLPFVCREHLIRHDGAVKHLDLESSKP